MKPSTRLKARAWRYAAAMLEDDVAARPGLPNETIKDREAILEHIVNSIIPSLRTRARIIARRKP